MNSKSKSFIFHLSSFIFLFGCGREIPLQPVIGREGVYILNGLAETISYYDTKEKIVWNDFDSTGAFPNQISLRQGLLYIVNSGSDDIQILDPSDHSQKGKIHLGGGNNSFNIAFVDGSKAYVTLWLAHKVASVNLEEKEVVKRIQVGKGPEGMAIAEGKLYVCNSGYKGSGNYDEGSVSVLSILNDSLLKTIPVGMNPQAIESDGEGEFQVVCTGDRVSIWGRIYLIDPIMDVVTDSLEIGGSPGSIAIKPNGKAYLGDGNSGILSYDTRTNQILRDFSNPILPGTSVSGVALDIQGNLYACHFDEDSLSILDTEGDTLIGKIGVGDGPVSVTILEE